MKAHKTRLRILVLFLSIGFLLPVCEERSVAVAARPEAQTGLKSKDPKERKAAADMLGNIGSKHAVGVLFRSLREEENVEVQTAVFLALMKIGPEAVEPILAISRKAQKKGNWKDLGAASALLVKIGSPAIQPLLQEGAKSLKDGNREMAEWVEETLAQIGLPVLQPSFRALKNQNPFIQLIAVRVLGRLGEKQAVKPLISVLDNDWACIQIAAIEALGRLGEEQAREPLIFTLRSVFGNKPEWPVRQAIVEALGGKLYDESVFWTLIATLKDEDEHPVVRMFVAETLGKLGDRRAMEPLREVIRSCNVKKVRWTAWKALRKLELTKPADSAKPKVNSQVLPG